QEADGLEWPLRLAALWQLLREAPLRRTQQGDFFKRDQERLTQDPRLNGAPAEALAEVPDIAPLTTQLGQLLGIAVQVDTELPAGTFPPEWQEDLVAVISSIWSVLPRLENWNPHRGWGASATVSGNPYPSACFLAIALLAGLPPSAWARAADVERWVIDRHP